MKPNNLTPPEYTDVSAERHEYIWASKERGRGLGDPPVWQMHERQRSLKPGEARY